jgi:hypothetical protein
MKTSKTSNPLSYFNKGKAEALKKANASMMAFKKSLPKKQPGGSFDGMLPPPTIGGNSGSMGSSTNKPFNASANVGGFSAGMNTNLGANKPLDSATYKAGYKSKSGFGANVGYDAANKKSTAGVSYDGTIGKKRKIPIKVDVSYNKPSKMGGAIKRGKSKK